MKDGFKKWLKKFPFFLDKRPTSNFYKNSSVLYTQLKQMEEDLFATHEQHRLNKNMLIWDEKRMDENDDLIYITYRFYAHYEHLKTVTILHDGETFYSESYDESDNESDFYYEYELPTQNGEDFEFVLIVDTYDEIHVEKGFPENNEVLNNVYDHDKSLDELGALYNITRKKYVYDERTNPEFTEPAYNTRLTEDDYRYLKRILFYIQNLNEYPLPVLEIWKLYGINPDNVSFVNRSHDLCKMYYESKHPEIWTPQEWEHKDSMDCSQPTKTFFFVTLDNYTPVMNSNIRFTFNFYDMYGKDTANDYLIDVYKNEELIDNDLNPNEIYKYTLTDEDVDGAEFYFIAKPLNEEANELVSDKLVVIVKGCNNADWYVDATNGDDANDGSRDHPFKTVNKAVNTAEGNKNTIVLKEGTHQINNRLIISQGIKILGCPEATIDSSSPIFFQIMNQSSLYLSNITLQYENTTYVMNDETFSNFNLNINPIFIKVRIFSSVGGIDIDVLDANGNIITSAHQGDEITLRAILMDEYGHTLIKPGETVEFYITG